MFSERASQQHSIQSRKDALLRRLQLRQVLSHVDAIEDGEMRRLKELRLSTVVRSARIQFDDALAALDGLMPNRITVLDGGAHPNPAITYTFDAAPNLSLALPFRIQVAIEICDDRSVVDVYARASKGLVGAEVGWTHLGGALESLDGISNAFQEWMLTIVDEMVSQ